jgi:peptidoglycan hydrolase-like protein with peptidoglycan-binding domain
MKKALFFLLVMALVFTMAVPVSLGAPDETATPEATATPEGTENTEGADNGDGSMPDDSVPQDTQSTFEILKPDSSGIPVFKVQMRLRDLGYLNYRPTGLYYTMTQNAVISFQQNNALDTDGQVGQITYDKLFSSDVVRKPLSASILVTSGLPLTTAPAPGEAADWSTVVDAAFPVGTTATVTDYNTSKSFTVQRTGGTGHADVETADAAAYTTFLECFNVQGDEKPTWEKRAVVVNVNGSVYAASLFGHPDGADTIADNSMDGHVCLYFSGSTSDVFGFVDKEHEKMVKVAAGQPPQY